MLGGHRHRDRVCEVVDVFWPEVGQVPVLGMIPDLFDRIQFGCLGG